MQRLSGNYAAKLSAKLSKPLLRIGERGKGEFKEIEWDEKNFLQIATTWLSDIRNTDLKNLPFLLERSKPIINWLVG